MRSCASARTMGLDLVKALVKAKPEPGLWLEDVPKPVPGDRDVLIRVRKTSICGTDLHIHHWDAWAQSTIPVPMVVGHEFMGEIEQLGADVVGPGSRPTGRRRGPRHLRPLPQLQGRPPRVLPQPHRRRRHAAGRVRRVRRDPRGERVRRAPAHRRQRRSRARSVGQRHAHRRCDSTSSARTC